MPPMNVIRRPSFIAVLIATGFSVIVTQLIYAGANTEAAQQQPPLAVQVAPFRYSDGYLSKAEFVGLVRAGNESALGFEVGGTIDDVLVREGAIVTRGQELAYLNTDRRQAQLEAARADVKRLDAQLELAGLQRRRTANLTEEGLASAQALDDARLSEAALKAARDVTLATVRVAELELTKSRLTAPYSGVVATRLAERGSVVNPGTPVLKLIADDSLEAVVGVPLEHSNSLQIGNTYPLKTRAGIIDSTLTGLRADLDIGTLTVGAVFSIEGVSAARPGETVLLQLAEWVTTRGGWLPLSALLEGDRGLWNVLTLGGDSASGYVAHREAVEVLHTEEDKVFVRGTLGDGSPVITSGVHRLSPGSPVAPAADQPKKAIPATHSGADTL